MQPPPLCTTTTTENSMYSIFVLMTMCHRFQDMTAGWFVPQSGTELAEVMLIESECAVCYDGRFRTRC